MLPARSRTEVTLGEETDIGALTIEPRTILKVRIRIIPCIFLLYIVAFLDRINIGFAALTMNKELAITQPAVWIALRDFLYRLFPLRDP